MRLVNAGEAQKLTGLTADQLREWTVRRGLIQPDQRPCGPGSRAQYAWQTVLLLRLAVVLKETFHIELHAQRQLFAGLAARLSKVSFPALRGAALVIHGDAVFEIVDLADARSPAEDALIIRLDPHLDALSTGFGVVEPIRQLPLFPAVVVR
jgi:DNA-binding transcriptional MerR regulator